MLASAACGIRFTNWGSGRVWRAPSDPVSFKVDYNTMLATAGYSDASCTTPAVAGVNPEEAVSTVGATTGQPRVDPLRKMPPGESPLPLLHLPASCLLFVLPS